MGTPILVPKAEAQAALAMDTTCHRVRAIQEAAAQVVVSVTVIMGQPLHQG